MEWFRERGAVCVTAIVAGCRMYPSGYHPKTERGHTYGGKGA